MKYFTGYKKSILTSIGFLYFIATAIAQEPGYARQLFQQRDWAAAKESIDSFVQTHTGNAAGWLLKASIYYSISNNPDYRDMMADGLMDAFMALQKAVQLDPGPVNEQLKKDHYQLAFDIYDGYTRDGILFFNAGVESNTKSSFVTALDKFKKAALVGKMISTNGWGLAAMDTSNICYTARAAMMAGKEDDAFFMAKKIADAGITNSPGGNSMVSIYQWLAFYYKKQHDGDNCVKYARLGMARYTTDTYFDLILIDWYRHQQAYNNLFEAYEQLFTKTNSNQQYQWAYLNDVFNYLYNNTNNITDRDLYQNQLSTGLTAYLSNNTNSAAARLLLAKIYINRANYLLQKNGKGKMTVAEVNTARKDLFKRSDNYLKEILSQFCKPHTKECREARQLLAANNRAMK